MEIRQLRHVLALAEHGNFHRAADSLDMSQPALSLSIKKLEQLLGAVLFDRQRRPVSLTPYGHIVVTRARAVFAQLDGVEEEISALAGLRSGTLAMGAGPLSAEYLVRPALGQFAKEAAGVRLSVAVDKVQVLEALLREDKLDFFIADVKDAISDDDFEVIPLPRQPMALYCRPGHPLTTRDTFDIREVQAYPLAAPALPEHLRQWLVQNLGRAYADQQPFFESENYSLIIGLVSCSDHLSAGTLPLFANALERGELIELAVLPEEFNSNPGIVHKAWRTLSPSAQSMIAELTTVAGGRQRHD